MFILIVAAALAVIVIAALGLAARHSPAIRDSLVTAVPSLFRSEHLRRATKVSDDSAIEIVRRAKRKDPNSWSNLLSGVGGGRDEEGCLESLEIPGVLFGEIATDVDIAHLPRDAEPSGYDKHFQFYTGIARPIRRLGSLNTAFCPAFVHLYMARTHEPRVGAVISATGPVDSISRGVDASDIAAIEAWLADRVTAYSERLAPARAYVASLLPPPTPRDLEESDKAADEAIASDSRKRARRGNLRSQRKKKRRGNRT